MMTPRERALLAYAARYGAEYGVMPSYREMAVELGYSSISTINRLLSQCARKGLVMRHPRKSRAWQITGVATGLLKTSPEEAKRLHAVEADSRLLDDVLTVPGVMGMLPGTVFIRAQRRVLRKIGQGEAA